MDNNEGLSFSNQPQVAFVSCLQKVFSGGSFYNLIRNCYLKNKQKNILSHLYQCCQNLDATKHVDVMCRTIICSSALYLNCLIRCHRQFFATTQAWQPGTVIFICSYVPSWMFTFSMQRLSSKIAWKAKKMLELGKTRKILLTSARSEVHAKQYYGQVCASYFEQLPLWL